MSAARDKGTRAESAARKWFCAHGFPWTERLAPQGADDCGDLSLLPGRAVIVEVKDHATAATGQPGDQQLTKWMRETETERVNAGADQAALVVKRKATSDVGRWWCYLPLNHLRDLCFGLRVNSARDDHTVCITTATWTELLRRAGWGSEWKDIA